MHAHSEVSMYDDIFQSVTGYSKKTATCLTDHNSISGQSTKIAQRQLISKFRELYWYLAQTIETFLIKLTCNPCTVRDGDN